MALRLGEAAALEVALFEPCEGRRGRWEDDSESPRGRSYPGESKVDSVTEGDGEE